MKAKKLSQNDLGTMKRLLPFIGRRIAPKPKFFLIPSIFHLFLSFFYFPLKNLFSAYTPSTRTPRTRKMPAIPAQSIERVTGRSAIDMG